MIAACPRRNHMSFSFRKIKDLRKCDIFNAIDKLIHIMLAYGR